jgi:hypothetical protein
MGYCCETHDAAQGVSLTHESRRITLVNSSAMWFLCSGRAKAGSHFKAAGWTSFLPQKLARRAASIEIESAGFIRIQQPSGCAGPFNPGGECCLTASEAGIQLRFSLVDRQPVTAQRLLGGPYRFTTGDCLKWRLPICSSRKLIHMELVPAQLRSGGSCLFRF